jgi:hypothetical protein
LFEHEQASELTASGNNRGVRRQVPEDLAKTLDRPDSLGGSSNPARRSLPAGHTDLGSAVGRSYGLAAQFWKWTLRVNSSVFDLTAI